MTWKLPGAPSFLPGRRAHSLREICGGLASVEGDLKRLGVGNAPAPFADSALQVLSERIAAEAE